MTTKPKALRSAFISLLKSLIEEDLSTEIVVNTCRNEVSFSLAGGQQEVLGLRCLTGTHVPMGALFAITFHVHVVGGTIYEILCSLLPKESFCTSLYSEYSSNLTKYAVFRNHGVVCFYAHDNLAAFTKKTLPNIAEGLHSSGFRSFARKERSHRPYCGKGQVLLFPFGHHFDTAVPFGRIGALRKPTFLLYELQTGRPKNSPDA